MDLRPAPPVAVVALAASPAVDTALVAMATLANALAVAAMTRPSHPGRKRSPALGHRYIKVMADYECLPLWVYTAPGQLPSNTDPADLAISLSLADRLNAWAAQYDASLNRDDPASSGFADPEDEDDYFAAGRLLAAELALELADGFEVAYFDPRYHDGRPLLPIIADGGVRIGDGALVLPNHWHDLAADPASRKVFESQLSRELPDGHILAGRPAKVIARCTRCDDILVHLHVSNQYAIVHLTWRQAREIAPQWPSTEVYANPAAVLADLSERHD